MSAALEAYRFAEPGEWVVVANLKTGVEMNGWGFSGHGADLVFVAVLFDFAK